MEPKYPEESKQTCSVYFQNAPSREQVLFMYRNALDDFIHKKVLEQKK